MAADLTTGETLDAAAVSALVAMLGDDVEALTEIVDAFLDEAPQRLAELRDGTTAGDAAVVGRAARTRSRRTPPPCSVRAGSSSSAASSRLLPAPGT